MKLFAKLRAALFKETDDSFVESRRRFLKGSAGLAAVAVIAAHGGMRLLEQSEIEKLVQMVRSGLVENQIFVLDRTAVLMGLRNVTFSNCQFIAAPGFVGETLLQLDKAEGLLITRCMFECKEIKGNSTAIRIYQQPGEVNQWKTLNSQ